MRSATTPVSGISLRRLFPRAQFFGASDIYLKSCCGDWRDCQPDDLFVAIQDELGDGHEAVTAAIEKGAAGVLCERMLPIELPQCVVPDTRQAYAQLCQTLAGNPSQILNTIAVTGSDGKTSIAHLLHSILRAARLSSSIISSWETSGKSFGQYPAGRQRENGLPPSDLANWMCDMALAGHEAAIVEVSSLQLAKHQISGVLCDSVAVSNIRRSHLHYHNSVKNYRQINGRILQHLKPGGIAAINLDDPVSHSMIHRMDVPAITYGIKQDAHLMATPLEQCPSEQTFLLAAGNEAVPVRTQIIGISHVYNCLAAAATALANNIDLPTIVRGLENVSRIPGRMDRVECGQNFAVYVDSANSPRRLSSALHAVKRVTSGQLIALVDSGPGPRSLRRELGRVLERHSSVRIITANQAPTDQHLETAHQVLDGFNEPARARIIPNRLQAIEWALAQAQPGDSVVLTGWGTQPVCFLDDGRWELTDREICQAWLYDQPISPIADSLHDNFDSHSPQIFRIEDFRR